VFQRFTEPARQVVVLAQDEARTLKHHYIGTEHILLGLIREQEGLGAGVLESLDIALEDVRAQVVRIVGQGDEVPTGQIPFTPRAKKVLDLSVREAMSLGHNSIGTEHVLLGVVRENEGVASRILLDLGADAETVRNEVIRQLGGARPSDYEEKMRRAGEAGRVGRYSRLPRRLSTYGGQLEHHRLNPVLLGWLLFAAALGIGILIGWAIWS
jgi:ATP-dependent Clp protease ATP-binding subunit ClpC